MITSIKALKVGLDFSGKIEPVGRLAIRDRIIYFEYIDEFIQKGWEVSPLRLPLKRGVTALPLRPFEGLAGLFSDSLPDGWGRLLFDRMMRTQGILETNISPLDRLAQVGMHGMGALVYEPDNSSTVDYGSIDLDQLAMQTAEVFFGESKEVLSRLLALNGSSAGARPKALISVDGDHKNISYGASQLGDGMEPWLVKFPNSQDGIDGGAIEYVYALMAKEAGLSIPEVHLYPSQKGCGYFAVKRFDRNGNKRLHMHTASGILHSDFRTPSLDYEDLLSLTGILTKDIREVEKLYRLAVFNVLAHNRDDHAKNFSFLMDEYGQWKLSPAYDLTFSSGPGGEQSTMVMGEGNAPQLSHLLKLGIQASLPKGLIDEILNQTKQALSRWKVLASAFNVTKSNLKLIGSKLK
ncbi:MAG TPA: type II toxin-antitoxin system HipA family toxin [Arachidicoccus sp.]|nr:type II toxin-antitoxin system HipA family toxin [Arachidicoccus sp.]